MAEILSQSQIDMLLNSLLNSDEPAEGEADAGGGGGEAAAAVDPKTAKKVKEYDFRSPKIFTREQLKLLYSVVDLFDSRIYRKTKA